MMTVVGTPLLALLRRRRLLKDRLRWLGLHDEQIVHWLRGLKSCPASPPAAIPSSVIETLQQHRLIRFAPASPAQPVVPEARKKPSLAFVQAVNLELTYDCNWDCGHCIQQGIRKRLAGTWLPTSVGNQVLKDAWFAGLLSAGVNFTGGEVFLPKSNLPELMEVARSLKIEVRINTNGWWGNRENIRVGQMEFRSPAHVVGWLRESGVALLALSYDTRYTARPEAWDSVASVIRECENQGQLYQIVCTGVGRRGAFALCDHLTERAGISPNRLVPMEMIDIGGASGQDGKPLQWTSALELGYCVPCGGKGFHRPTLLHIAPDGGVRTCLYAPGGGWMGNVNRESLLNIVNRFAENPVAAAFTSGEAESFAETNIKPYAQVYRSVNHPCAALAVLARAIEAASEPNAVPLPIHDRIASDFNIHAKVLTGVSRAASTDK